MEAIGATMRDVGPLAFVLLAGVAAVGAWRLAGIAVGSRLSIDHPVFEWARAVAVAVVAAQAAILVTGAAAPVGDLSLALRFAAVAAGYAVYHFSGRSVLLGVAAGDAIILVALLERYA